MKLLLYCTKAKPYLYKSISRNGIYITKKNKLIGKMRDNEFNGKIVAECDFEVKYFNVLSKTIEGYKEFERKDVNYVLERSCLSYTELVDYLGENKVGYAIHIKNLHIFDEPKKITTYHCKTNKKDELCLNGGCGYKFFHKAPQNMMKVYDHWGKGNEYILISIQSQWLCKILNGEKTIEVRKKVLKEMLR